ncbi:SGNH/GDSL hydrolase family protein [Neobacillus niacini]|uniref:SGNH/GDSL hydrolase family protein n=1 Tax=Neobacillus niacini TaxID=86668 RepID=UPI00203EB1BF|nr:SGNH/GDSL hydrolase family protein [Neobacillus niacini]MCM3693165.1 SGNH/GDSL hydrolase family protein [Neobacillus niacini]
MKNILTVLLGIACITVIILGNSYWNERIQSAKATEDGITTKQNSNTKSESKNKETDNNDVIALASNWPASAIERFKQTQAEDMAFKILFVGSSSIGSETAGTYPVVKEKMIDSFGEKNVQLSLKTFDLSSSEFINNNHQEEVAAETADLVVIEPFILMDNGVVEISYTLENLSFLIEAIRIKNPEASIIIQPGYPLHNAKYYPIQVEAVKDYAVQNGITYLDHWTAWPDYQSDEMIEYLLPEQNGPSDKGVQIWSEFLLNYFISKQ